MVTIQVFDRDLQAVIQKAREQVNDLTVPFKLIGQSWFKTNRALSSLKGPGKFVDLKPEYKRVKAKKWGFVYPILGASGRLLSSITTPGPESINLIINKRTLLLGSTVPYGIYHQLGTKTLPRRPWILVGAEQTAPPELNKRKEAWVKMIHDYVRQVIARRSK